VARRFWPLARTWYRRGRWLLAALLILANYALVTTYLLPDRSVRVEVPYTYFKRQVEDGNVVEVVSRGDIIQGTLKQAVTYPPEGGERARTTRFFSTVRPAFAEPGLETLLDQQGVEINARPLELPREWWMTLLLGLGPPVIIIWGLIWFSRRSGLFQMGRSRARRYDEGGASKQRATFADVAGIEESKSELVEIVDFLKNPAKYTRLGGTAPRGVLLVGPPGTGKTLLARAVAGEAGVPFFGLGASEFVEMVVGVGASRVRDLFQQARQAAPSIIFVDELDAVGRARGNLGTLSNRESEQTLNQILTEMDGFCPREAVIVLAATNRPDVLDPALLRPGRFDRRVVVQPPDKNGRLAILEVHTRQVPLGADVDLKRMAEATPGLVGADLRNLVNEAALLAAARDKRVVEEADFLDALEKVTLGPARQLLLSFEDRQRIAYHESGHTILGLLVAGADPVNRVTIMPRGHALGVTYQRPEDDHHNLSEGYLHARIIGALGGRAAEEVVYGTVTTGAESDLHLVTDLARHMVTRWGMSKTLGPLTFAAPDAGYLSSSEPFGTGGAARPYSETFANLIDGEVQRIVNACYQEALRLLAAHRAQLDALASALLDQETLDEAEILAATGLARAPRLPNLPMGGYGETIKNRATSIE
jgi:cell division protease FtsH